MQSPTLYRTTVVLCALGMLVTGKAQAQPGARMLAPRGATLQIDGKSLGMVQSFEGGYVVGDVVAEKLGPDNATMKHIANIHYVPLTIRGDVGDLDDVAITALSGMTRVNGALTTQSFDMKPMGTQTFMDALVTRIALPDLDVASRDPLYMEVELTPERIKRMEGGPSDSKMGAKQRRLMRSNFRVDIPGLETKRVMSVSGLTLTRPVVADAVGDTREPAKVPMRWNASNVVLTINAADAQSWYAWADDFLINGNAGQDKEKTIEVHVLSPDMRDVLVLRGSGVGLVSVRPATGTSNDQLQRFQAELYVEKWDIVKGPGAEP